MRIKIALAILGSCLFALSANAVAAMKDDGSDTCVQCHDADAMPDWSKSAHAFAADNRTPTCKTCHGPSEKHLESPSNSPDRVFSRNGGTPANERSAACLACHNKDTQRMLWGGSAHDAADVACTSCHQVHVNHDKVLSKSGQVETCYRCHKEQRVELARPSRHPVPEGKMTCTDCHNVHGSSGPKLAKRDSFNDTCFTCHAEKRGPFVHPHEPAVDDCANCHNPHGSTVAAMLKARPPMLCQQCHTPHVAGGVGALGGQPGVFPPAVAGQAAPQITATTGGKNVVNIWQGRSCLNCHTQVHGSNNPSATNPTPQFLLR